MDNKDETKNNLNAEEQLRTFVSSLVSEKNFDVAPEVLQQIKEDVYDRAEDIINATIMANTPPEKLEELEQLLNEPNKQNLEDFCNTNIPDLQEKIAQALVQFRSTYLGLK